MAVPRMFHGGSMDVPRVFSMEVQWKRYMGSFRWKKAMGVPMHIIFHGCSMVPVTMGHGTTHVNFPWSFRSSMVVS